MNTLILGNVKSKLEAKEIDIETSEGMSELDSRLKDIKSTTVSWNYDFIEDKLYTQAETVFTEIQTDELMAYGEVVIDE